MVLDRPSVFVILYLSKRLCFPVRSEFFLSLQFTIFIVNSSFHQIAIWVKFLLDGISIFIKSFDNSVTLSGVDPCLKVVRINPIDGVLQLLLSNRLHTEQTSFSKLFNDSVRLLRRVCVVNVLDQLYVVFVDGVHGDLIVPYPVVIALIRVVKEVQVVVIQGALVSIDQKRVFFLVALVSDGILF